VAFGIRLNPEQGWCIFPVRPQQKADIPAGVTSAEAQTRRPKIRLGPPVEEGMNVGIRFLQIAAVYLVVGLSMGLAMAISSNMLLTTVHAHILLLGWATMALAGIVYLLMPGCGRSVLARVHFWGHNIGFPIMMASLALFLYGLKSAEKAVAISSVIVLASLLVLAINLFRNGSPESGK
jgi:hypothetical protein